MGDKVSARRTAQAAGVPVTPGAELPNPNAAAAVIGFPAESRSFHDRVWRHARVRHLAFRRIYDVRCALSMIAQGVTEFATANVKDFDGLGLRRASNPLASC